MQQPDGLFDRCDILATDKSTDEVRVSIGDNQTGVGFQSSTSVWGVDGFCSAPDAPDANGTCEALFVRNGDEKIVIGRRDRRIDAKSGNLQPGDKAIITSGASRVVVKKSDNSVVLYTTDNGGDDGNGVYLKLAGNKLEFRAPWGRLTFDASGLHISTVHGATFDMGGLSGIPAPLSALSTYVHANAATCSLRAPTVLLGPSAKQGGGAFLGVVYGELPPTAIGVPILGVGVGAVTIAAAASTHVYVTP